MGGKKISKSKSKSQPEPQPEPVSSSDDEDDDANQQIDDDNGEIEEADAGEGASEDEAEEGEGEDSNAKAAAATRNKTKARRRGYRNMALRGGYATTHSSADASKDVCANLVSINEAIRACKWTPGLPESVAFDSIEEFEERVAIGNEPLAPAPAAVFRASIEVFARKLVLASVQSAFDAGLTRVTPAFVAMHTRPLQRALKFSFHTPHGAIRYAQTSAPGERLRMNETDKAEIKRERKVVEKQHEVVRAVKAENKKRKAERAEKSEEKKAKRSLEEAENAAAVAAV